MPRHSAQFDAALLSLSRIHVEAGASVRAALRSLAAIVLPTLGLGRFSVWLSAHDGTAIRLYFLHRPSIPDVLDGTVLRVEDFPAYFAALQQARTVPVRDGATDPIVAELRAAYLGPLGIGALLDAPIHLGADQVGVVCHEFLGGPRDWTAEECEFAADVAGQVVRLLEEGGRLQAEDSLRAYQSHLEELGRFEGMGRLAAGVAHDFRNLLTVVGANCDLIRGATDDPAVLDSVEAIRDAVTRSRLLADEMLQFGRDRPGGPAVLDPSEVVQSLARLLRDALGPPHELEVVAPTTASRVFAVRSELERALLNLVSNAREALGEAGRVSVRVDEVTAGGASTGLVGFTVVDTGRGMDAATLARVREPFFTTKASGAGLGLVLVDQIVSRAGGTLRILSQPGEGTAVTALLPRIA